MMNAINLLFLKLCVSTKSFIKEEKGAVDIVAIVVLIGIAVLLAVLFKTQVSNLLRSLFEQITGQATTAVTQAA